MIRELRSKQTTTFIIFLMLGTMLYLIPEKAAAKDKKAEDHLFKVICRNQPNGISPNTVTVKPGETVVWYNNDPDPIKIRFLTKGMMATKAPVNFIASGSGRYESAMIPQGGAIVKCCV